MLNFKNGVNWVPALFLIVYQVALLAALPFYFYYATPSIGMYIITFILLYATGLSITGGYHRFYAHRTFKVHKLMEWILLFFGSMAGQGSVLRWSFDHRSHHAHVDTDADPYSIKKGFWYAHFLWILEKPKTIEPKVVPDLLNNRLVILQDRFYGLFFLGTNALVFLTIGWLLNDYLGSLVLAIALRLFLLHHFTWFINSLAHTWGDKPFSQEHSAVNNYIISLLTFGEGYHNYHHTYANDYRNGVYWYQFDPTKWLIWLLSKVGLVHHLRKTDIYMIKKRLITEHKNLLLDRLFKSLEEKQTEWEPIIHELSEKLVTKMSAFSQLKQRYHELKRQCSETHMLSDLKNEMKALKKSLREDWKQWWKLSRMILSHA